MKKIVLSSVATLSLAYGADCSGYGGVELKYTSINGHSSTLLLGGGGLSQSDINGLSYNVGLVFHPFFKESS